MGNEVEALRAQLRLVVTLTDAASGGVVPRDAQEAGALVASVKMARDALLVLLAQLAAASKPQAETSQAEQHELVGMVGEVTQAGQRLVAATASALAAARRFGAS